MLRMGVGQAEHAARIKSLYAAIAQSVERILGKDEVSGSNPDSSSRKTRWLARDSGFLLCLAECFNTKFALAVYANANLC